MSAELLGLVEGVDALAGAFFILACVSVIYVTVAELVARRFSAKNPPSAWQLTWTRYFAVAAVAGEVTAYGLHHLAVARIDGYMSGILDALPAGFAPAVTTKVLDSAWTTGLPDVGLTAGMALIAVGVIYKLSRVRSTPVPAVPNQPYGIRGYVMVAIAVVAFLPAYTGGVATWSQSVQNMNQVKAKLSQSIWQNQREAVMRRAVSGCYGSKITVDMLLTGVYYHHGKVARRESDLGKVVNAWERSNSVLARIREQPCASGDWVWPGEPRYGSSTKRKPREKAI